MQQDENKINLSFGEPESIRNEHIFDYLGVYLEGNGEYYSPPISFASLAKMRKANCQHGSCILLRRNMASNAFVAGPVSIDDFRNAVTDFLSTGNAFFEIIVNKLGNINKLIHVPTINMRVKTHNKGYRQLLKGGKYIDFSKREVIQVAEYDEVQQIYGMPDWLGGLQSALLNEDATLFRRRYYVNGAHLGYILLTTDSKMSPQLVNAFQEKFKDGKGVGNFKSAYVHIPNGKEDCIKVIPIGDISQKDEFLNIKNVSATDVLTAHRVPPALMGIIPQGASSLGDHEKVERVYIRNEVKALCLNFININKLLPTKLHFKFNFNVEETNEK